MESMDHEQALAVLGLSGAALPDDIEAHYAQRRRQLERRWITSHSDVEKRVLEAQMRELDAARDAALRENVGPLGRVPGATVALKAGTVVADRYVVRAKIGHGPRGAVFRALDLNSGKEAALKVLAPQLMLVPGATRRVAEAIRAVFGMAHPNIARVYGLVDTGAHTILVSELVEGRSLAEPAAPEGWTQGRSAADILRVLGQIAAGLKHAQRKSLHLNLTPRNVLIGPGGAVRLTDFMINHAVPVLAAARAVEPEQAPYIAPELLALTRSDTPDLSGIDARADQYSMAALAYTLAAGVPPDATRRPLASLRPDLPEAFVAAVERALALAPEARFDSFDDFLAHAAARPRRLRMFARRAAAGLIVAGLAVLAVVGLRHAGETGLGAGTPLAAWLPGAEEARATRLQAEALQARVRALRQILGETQRGLQRRGTDARLTLAAAERQAAQAGAAADGPALADARRGLAMVQALNDLVTPGVFNHPDVLNAYNLLGLGDEHVARGRFAEAVTVLTGAEAALTAKLRDLREAELLIERRFGGPLPSLGARPSLPPAEAAARMKQDWLDAVEQRRRFAARLDAGLVLIPAGRFVMGDAAGEGSRSERPVREVAVAAFKLGRTEVTRAEYAACVAAGACAAPAAGDAPADAPAAGLSWLDAQAYVDWLRVVTGEDYRLPSEAEWEYAARAGGAAAYPWGESVGRARANCLDCGSAWDGVGPAPVGSFAANAFGLFDTTGNVWEWTADCWYRDYTSAPPTAAAREGTGACEKRVLRGGSWDNAAWLARVSYRAFAPAATRQDIYGLRIAKSVE